MLIDLEKELRAKSCSVVLWVDVGCQSMYRNKREVHIEGNIEMDI